MLLCYCPSTVDVRMKIKVNNKSASRQKTDCSRQEYRKSVSLIHDNEHTVNYAANNVVIET